MTEIQRDASGRVVDSEAGAALVRARWDKTPRVAEKRVRAFAAGSPIERRWLKKADELGLTYDGMSHTAHRRLAHRLAADDTARRVRRIHEPRPAVLSDDDDLLIAHLAAEAARWRARAKRDHQIALAHDIIADQAESDLADIMWKRGLTS